jgi:hypothetical protein
MERNLAIKLIKDMRDMAVSLDALGMVSRKATLDYKAKEYFDSADYLRIAANKLEYTLA